MARQTPGEALAKAGAPWYEKGLRFECRPDCGACCTNHDDYAYVYLLGGEAEKLAGFLGLTTEEFLRRHTEVVDRHIVLRMDQPDCPFLSGSRCSVYPARPVQCRSFPFWDENLLDRDSWERVGAFCPGVDRGEMHSLAVIQDHVRSRKA